MFKFIGQSCLPVLSNGSANIGASDVERDYSWLIVRATRVIIVQQTPYVTSTSGQIMHVLVEPEVIAYSMTLLRRAGQMLNKTMPRPVAAQDRGYAPSPIDVQLQGLKPRSSPRERC